jgi:class 3 adenylate cyclase
VNTTGDGFLAMFSGAGAALHAATGMRADTREMGIDIRVGVHTGEVELLPDDLRGLAVHAAARIMSLGGAGEVMVSATTRDLVDDARDRLKERGAFELKGLDRPMVVYALGQ